MESQRIKSGMSGPFTYLAAAAIALVQGSPNVTDGDTIRIGETRIRLEGIDAPELSQRCTRADGSGWQCGAAARAALIQKVGNQSVRYEMSGTDRYDRRLANAVADFRRDKDGRIIPI